jgi:DHA2 family multidrug resistance protein
MNSQSSEWYRWSVLGILMVGTFTIMLNSSIVNIALPQMMSSFGVNRNQIEWVSTGFMLSSAVAMPLVGWIVGRIGSKALYLISLCIFSLGTVACAVSWNYDAMIVSRAIQAIGAGGMQPVGMAIIANLFEPHERGKAIGVWATGMMIGPAFGPTLGGYITDWLSWRAVFWVNLPPALFALVGGAITIKSEKSETRFRIPFDLWGYIFLSIALIAGLLALSKGQEKGWDSTYTYACFAFTIVGLVMFIAIESSIRHPLLDLRLFLYRNYSIGMVLSIFRGVGLFGMMFLLPIFLQNLGGYTAIDAGILMMPGALTILFIMPIAGRLADRYSPKVLVTLGTLVVSLSLFWYGYLDPISSTAMIIAPQVVRGIGIAFMISPIMATSINAVPLEKVPMASSFLNVAQRIGGSFGIAFINTFVTNSIIKQTARMGELVGTQSRTFQYSTHEISEAASRLVQGVASNPRSIESILSSMFRHIHDAPSSEHFQGIIVILRMISQKASVIGFEHGFVLSAWIVLASIPLVFMLKTGWYQPSAARR